MLLSLIKEEVDSRVNKSLILNLLDLTTWWLQFIDILLVDKMLRSGRVLMELSSIDTILIPSYTDGFLLFRLIQDLILMLLPTASLLLSIWFNKPTISWVILPLMLRPKITITSLLILQSISKVTLWLLMNTATCTSMWPNSPCLSLSISDIWVRCSPDGLFFSPPNGNLSWEICTILLRKLNTLIGSWLDSDSVNSGVKLGMSSLLFEWNWKRNLVNQKNKQ
mgnify:CR=1 FL=1